jgi:hypothetical protein
MTWDITISRCLSIVLVAAVGARSGDVTVAPLDRHALPYLAYKDVVLRMKKGGSTIDDLHAVLTPHSRPSTWKRCRDLYR